MDFKAQLLGVVQKAERKAHRKVADAIFSLAEEVITTSPVRQPDRWYKKYPTAAPGHFKNNWQIGIGHEPTNSISGSDATGSAAITRVFETLSNGFNVKNKDFYLVNNAKAIKGDRADDLDSYASAIEYGVGLDHDGQVVRSSWSYELSDKGISPDDVSPPGAVLGRAKMNWVHHVHAANTGEEYVPF